MVIKKYNLTLRNFSYNITNIVLKSCVYNSIEEYEFETNNPNFNLYIDSCTNHFIHSQDIIENIYNQNDLYLYVPISYLSDETKHYLFNKHICKHGYNSFDEYFLCYSNTMPCIILNIPKYFIDNTQTQIQTPAQTEIASISKNTHNVQIKCVNNTETSFEPTQFNTDNLFIIEPIIDFKNLYCKNSKNKLVVRAFNIELDKSIRPHDYINKTWNIFNTVIKYNKHQKGWIFPMMYKKDLLTNGVLFI